MGQIGELEMKEMLESMRSLFDAQLSSLRARMSVMGMRVLVSEKKISIMRETGPISLMMSTMGLHAAPVEISFDFLTADEMVNGRSYPEITQMQRKLMILMLIGEITRTYMELLKNHLETRKGGSDMPDLDTEEGRAEARRRIKDGVDEIQSNMSKSSPLNELAKKAMIDELSKKAFGNSRGN